MDSEPSAITVPAKYLVVLLGHENLGGNGLTRGKELSPIARARCAIAAEFLHASPESRVMTTGCNGYGFNHRLTPHVAFLHNELSKRGVSPLQIVPPAMTNGTHEDLLVARKRLLDLQGSPLTPGEQPKFRLLIVTHPAHAPRTSELLERIFPDMRLWIELLLVVEDATSQRLALAAYTMSHEHCLRDEGEQRKTELAERLWVDIPLYQAGADFPTQLHESAANEVRHYDSVAHAVVAGYLAIAAAVAVFVVNPPEHYDRAMTAAAIFVAFLITVFLFNLYCRSAEFARHGRSVMKHLEIAWERPGFSWNVSRMTPIIDAGPGQTTCDVARPFNSKWTILTLPPWNLISRRHAASILAKTDAHREGSIPRLLADILRAVALPGRIGFPQAISLCTFILLFCYLFALVRIGIQAFDPTSSSAIIFPEYPFGP
jgi:hypothetical protein